MIDPIEIFIQEYYLTLFLSVYDSLLPGAFKVDLFHYLVLLMHSGMYASIDLILKTILDTLLLENLSFTITKDKLARCKN